MEKKQERSSNIELFRILVMLAIVAHHYVVNSGLISADSPMMAAPATANAIFYWLFGMWGKTGINCFVLITGFFMCCSDITIKKYLKLYLQVKFYRYVIWGIFIAVGISSFSPVSFILKLFPFSNISYSFTNAFMCFFLFIPFLNVVVRNLSKKQHLLLIALCLATYTFCYQMPKFVLTYNYVSWFIVLYIISSYMRFYGLYKNESCKFWGIASVGLIFASAVSVILGMKFFHEKLPIVFVKESLGVLPLATSICLFMFFKNIKMGYSKIINTIASTTFGVFLIHTCGNDMRQWLWYKLLDVKGHYNDSHYALYACLCVICVFAVCSLIDYLRGRFLEKPIFAILDKRISWYTKKLKIQNNCK